MVKNHLVPETEVVGVNPVGEEQRLKVEETLESEEKRELSPEQQEALLSTMQSRFEAHPERHEGVEWHKVRASLDANPEKLWSLQQLEETGGEPDVFMADEEGFVIGDCSAESPIGRRNVTFDRRCEEILNKMENEEPAKGNAVDLTAKWGAELMSEEQYNYLQGLNPIDLKTWNWLRTKPDGNGAYNFHRLYNDKVGQSRTALWTQMDNGGFRCVLRFSWA
ncbi:DUF4256 domain-containing protein [Patescibacteria group bacterium]|nr:DUF4256 domain-containing protein [Patescibacteria group bacterium]